jgi:hypothetical protein
MSQYLYPDLKDYKFSSSLEDVSCKSDQQNYEYFGIISPFPTLSSNLAEEEISVSQTQVISERKICRQEEIALQDSSKVLNLLHQNAKLKKRNHKLEKAVTKKAKKEIDLAAEKEELFENYSKVQEELTDLKDRFTKYETYSSEHKALKDELRRLAQAIENKSIFIQHGYSPFDAPESPLLTDISPLPHTPYRNMHTHNPTHSPLLHKFTLTPPRHTHTLNIQNTRNEDILVSQDFTYTLDDLAQYVSAKPSRNSSALDTDRLPTQEEYIDEQNMLTKNLPNSSSHKFSQLAATAPCQIEHLDSSATFDYYQALRKNITESSFSQPSANIKQGLRGTLLVENPEKGGEAQVIIESPVSVLSKNAFMLSSEMEFDARSAWNSKRRSRSQSISSNHAQKIKQQEFNQFNYPPQKKNPVKYLKMLIQPTKKCKNERAKTETSELEYHPQENKRYQKPQSKWNYLHNKILESDELEIDSSLNSKY